MSAADAVANEVSDLAPTMQPDSMQPDSMQPDSIQRDSIERDSIEPALAMNADPGAASDGDMNAEAANDTTSIIDAERPEAHEGLLWMVTGESNPFQQRLTFTHNAVPILDLTLDPLLLRDLITSLVHVQEAQRTVLGVGAATSQEVAASLCAPTTEHTDSTPVEGEHPAAAAIHTASSSVTDELDADGDTGANHGETAPPVAIGSGAFTTFAWWRTHKLLAFLLAFAVMAFILGTVTAPR